MRRHLKQGKDMIDKARIGSTKEETTMQDDELETVEHLHGKSPDKNID